MEIADALLVAVYTAYIAGPALPDEVWMRRVLAASSFGFIIWGVLVDIPVAVLFNVLFAAISIYHIIRIIRQRRPVTLTELQRWVSEHLFPALSPREFLLFFDVGTPRDIEGDLTTEGEQLDRMWVLLSGEVDVMPGETVVATLNSPCFIGEMAYVSGGPASATIRVGETARVMEWTRDELADMEREDPRLSHALRSGIALDLVNKMAG